MKLSAVMPVYNERATLRAVVERVLAVPLDIELVCVDDGSSDGSREILAELQAAHPQIKVFLQPLNMGKGAALRRGIQEATHSVGNSILTLLSNCLTNINLSDMETCYKVFRREVIQSIPIEENRFGFEPEITVKIAKRRLRIYEVGISYWGRTYEEGKKIGWKDGVRALWCLVKYAATEPAVPAASRTASAPMIAANENTSERNR